MHKEAGADELIDFYFLYAIKKAKFSLNELSKISFPYLINYIDFYAQFENYINKKGNAPEAISEISDMVAFNEI